MKGTSAFYDGASVCEAVLIIRDNAAFRHIFRINFKNDAFIRRFPFPSKSKANIEGNSVSNAKPSKLATLEEVRSKEFLGHPAGLWVLFTTEMWERFCYYGMRALLVLYLISTLTDPNPGFGWTEESANKLYGWYTGLVYLFPLLGGFIADRFLGRHRSVLLGGTLMAAGEFCLFYTEYFRQHATSTITPDSCPTAFWCFMLGLFLMTLGNGFFKPCISVMVGDLYEKNDGRRDSAFNLFYMGINFGAFLAPFIAGSIGENQSWHWGFLTAGVGMVFGLCTYSFFRAKYLGPIGLPPKQEKAAKDAENDKNETDAAQSPKSSNAPLSRKEIDRVVVILTLTFFCVAFWSIFEQAGTALNIFAKKETNRQVPAKVGQALPGFLANQDELDAKIAAGLLRSDLSALNNELDALQNDALKTETLDKTLALDFDGAVATVESADLEAETAQELNATIAAVKESIATAEFALGKANEARKKVGQEPLDFSVADLKTLLAEGLKEKAEFDAQVDELVAKEGEKLVGAAEADLATLREGLIKDLASKKQEEFLAAEAKKVDPKTAIYTFPTTWYQSVNALAVLIFVPFFNLLWGFLRRRNMEPSTPVKFGVGLAILGVAFLFMVGGALQSTETGGNAGAYWLLITYIFCTWGELCLSPVGLSMVSRLAPPRYASQLMGVWFLSSAVAGWLSGYLVAIFGSGENRVSIFFGEKGGLADYFLMMAIVPFVAGLIVFALSPKLRKMMHEND